MVEKNEELLCAMVKAGADLCAPDCAIEGVRRKLPLRTYKLLVEKAKDLNVQEAHGVTALRVAKQSASEYVHVLLPHGKHLANKSIDEILQLLCDAVCAGDFENAKMLMGLLSPINVCDPAGRLALVEASKRGDEEMVNLLLHEGGDSNLKDGRGFWPALVADRRVLQLVPSTRSLRDEDLIHAIEEKNEGLVFVMLKAGVDPCAPDGDGLVLLIQAIHKRLPLKTFKVLVEKAKDLNVEDADGMTAVQCARKRGAEYELGLVQAQKQKCLGTGTYKHQ